MPIHGVTSNARNFRHTSRFQWGCPLVNLKQRQIRVATASDPNSPLSEPPVAADPNLDERVQTQSTGRAVASATAGIGALHLVRFVIGFVAQPLIAHSVGLSWLGDVYQVSTDILMRFWLVFEKVINPAFLPNFIAALKEQGEERAWKFCSTAVWIVSALLLLASALGWAFMPQLVGLLSQKAGAQQIALTVEIARILMFALFFLGFSSLTYTILNGYKRFVYAALGDALWKFGVFAGAAAAYFLYGKQISALAKLPVSAVQDIQQAQQSQLFALSMHSVWLIVAGFMIGAVGKLAPHVFAIGPKWRLLRPKIDLNDPLARTMFALAVPLLLGIMVSETRGFYLVRLADDPSINIEASRFALKLSRIIGDNLIQIFPYALSIGIFPFLADLAREKDRQPLTDTLMGALRVCVFVFVPLTAILIALREPLLRAVWEGGRMTQADTLAITPPFVAFTLGLVGFSCEMMLNQTFYAMTRAWTPTLIGLATSVLWIVLAKWGVEGLGWGLAAIAGAEAISKSVKCLIMWVWLRPHLGQVKVRDNLVFLGKVVLGAVLAALVAVVLARFLAPSEGAARFKLRMLGAVALSGLGAMGVFAVFAAALRVDEMKFAGRIWRRVRRS